MFKGFENSSKTVLSSENFPDEFSFGNFVFSYKVLVLKSLLCFLYTGWLVTLSLFVRRLVVIKFEGGEVFVARFTWRFLTKSFCETRFLAKVRALGSS